MYNIFKQNVQESATKTQRESIIENYVNDNGIRESYKKFTDSKDIVILKRFGKKPKPFIYQKE